jgi:hypothetical protein
MRVWVIGGIIVVAILLALVPLVAYVIDSQTRVSGPQMVDDMKALGAVVKGMGPAFQDVGASVTPDRSRIIVAGTVASEDDRNRLRDTLRSTPVKAPLSRVTFDVKVKGK